MFLRRLDDSVKNKDESTETEVNPHEDIDDDDLLKTAETADEDTDDDGLKLDLMKSETNNEGNMIDQSKFRRFPI